ncbi:g10802 [Coccomyxa elongata]
MGLNGGAPNPERVSAEHARRHHKALADYIEKLVETTYLQNFLPTAAVVLIATTILNKLKKLHWWKPIDSKALEAQQAAQTSHRETDQCEVPEADDLTVCMTSPPSAPGDVGPSNLQGSIASPTSDTHAVPADQNGSKPRRQKAIQRPAGKRAVKGSPG